ncbi:unnamed protein product, partial [marine sediment metagenome]
IQSSEKLRFSKKKTEKNALEIEKAGFVLLVTEDTNY